MAGEVQKKIGMSLQLPESLPAVNGQTGGRNMSSLHRQRMTTNQDHEPGSEINNQDACPEPCFTDQAKRSILRLLHVVWSTAGLCY